MSIILFALIGHALKLSGGYWFALGLYLAYKLVVVYYEVMSMFEFSTDKKEEDDENDV